ncbi:hypothetical protein SDC9_119207 [bioreactor metagenome]|uniref:Uncharacterized protein n=1 Tax=bioreactor metagenome TaxID=1076179 RepID=A0A645C9C6_9ZZZZ
MRLFETDSKEKRLFRLCHLFYVFYSCFGYKAVSVSVVRNVGTFGCLSALSYHIGWCCRLYVWNTPRLRIVSVFFVVQRMVNLPDTNSFITVVFKVLREGYGRRIIDPEIPLKSPTSYLVGAESCEKACSCRSAESLLAIVIHECHPVFCKSVKVRSVCTLVSVYGNDRP